ncbi:MAG: glycosyl hydrolase, partial [Bacteroidota bacterium]
EFSCFATVDGGAYWRKLSSGLPTVAVRDINIQERENDLVLATFGRGFYIMDDYSALRELTPEVLEEEAHLFSVRDAFQYQPYSPIAASNTISWLGPKGFQGETYYLGKNPKFGAAFTYFLKDTYQSKEDLRKEAEGDRRKEGEDVFYPTYDQLSAEAKEEAAYLIFTVRDANGEVVDEVRTNPSKGINRVYWDLKYPDIDNVNTRKGDPTSNLSSGIMVLPGAYTVELAKSIDGMVTPLTKPVSFMVKDLDKRTLPATDPAAMLAYHRELSDLSKDANALRGTFNELNERLEYYQAALRLVDNAELDKMVVSLEEKLKAIQIQLYGDPIKRRLEIDQAPSLTSRINTAIWTGRAAGDPTKTSAMVKAIAEEQLGPV